MQFNVITAMDQLISLIQGVEKLNIEITLFGLIARTFGPPTPIYGVLPLFLQLPTHLAKNEHHISHILLIVQGVTVKHCIFVDILQTVLSVYLSV